eukprot:COSAG06_NODE_20033_length_812_cov_0.942496_1_plen_171_part_10
MAELADSSGRRGKVATVDNGDSARRAARCSPSLTIGACVPMEDVEAGGRVATVEVLRYQEGAVVFRFPDGKQNTVGSTVEEAAELSRQASTRMNQLDRWAERQVGAWVRIPSATAGTSVRAQVAAYRDGWFSVIYFAGGKRRMKPLTVGKLHAMLNAPSIVPWDERQAQRE